MPEKLTKKHFTDRVGNIVDELREFFGLVESRKKEKDLIISDIIDDAGHQYIDLVMEGGGVLGIALVGYIYVLERMNIRFLGIGGTSAGSITALLLAAVGDGPADAKSEKILERLAMMPMREFVDGDEGARKFIDYLLRGDEEQSAPSIGKAAWRFASDAATVETREMEEIAQDLRLAPRTVSRLMDRLRKSASSAVGFSSLSYHALGILDDLILRHELGLNPGEAFFDWIKEILKDEGITKQKDLEAKLQKLPASIHFRESRQDLLRSGRRIGSRLRVIAADVATETKVIFPDMAPLFFLDPQEVNPARFVRASMSVPFFFRPLEVKCIHGRHADEEAAAAYRREWRQVGYQDGVWPERHFFIDGGIMSNFPIDLFHRPACVPASPTFGVKLGKDLRRRVISSLGGLTGAVFDAARHCLDYDFILRNPDYQHLITSIDTGPHHWLDFDLAPEAKLDLFLRGALAAQDFLMKFDWERYKKIRESLSQAFADSDELRESKGKDPQTSKPGAAPLEAPVTPPS